jgi:hypothetical protein
MEREMQIAAAAMIAAATMGSDASSPGRPATALRVADLKPQYCVDVESIPITIENTAESVFRFSTSIERLEASGQWEDYVADVFATEPFPWQVRVLRLEKHRSTTLRWNPRRTGRELREGSYRVVVNVLTSRPPATEYVVGRFMATAACRERP